MAEVTGIAWCDSTFNPFIGCTKISPGCDSCYAEALDKRHRWGGAVHWGAGVPRQRTSPANWKKPIAWNARPFYECKDCGWRGETPSNCPGCAGEVTTARRRVFCASLADVFDNEVAQEWRSDLWNLIVSTPRLDWLLLTKRIGNARAMLPLTPPLPNVWLGASVVNQEEADRDIPKLLATPAAKRFVSYEPALGPVLWPHWLGPQFMAHGQVRDENTLRAMRALSRAAAERTWGTHYIDWIIIGGESSQGKHRARPFDIGWARNTVAQCKAASVPVFVKQLGSNPINGDDGGHPISDWGFKDRAGADPAEWPEDLRVQCFPE